METTANLFEYINTPYSEFNKCAFQLFLENRKKKAFVDDELPLAIFYHIFVLVIKYEKNVFSFIEEYTTYIEAYQLTFQQETIIYSFAKKFFSISPRSISSYFTDATQFAAYFKMLEEIAVESQMEVAGNDVSATALHIINMQVLRLQEDIEREPLEQRMKLIATLVKIIAQYQKLTAPAKTKPVTATKNKPQLTNENAATQLAPAHIPAQIINENEPQQAAVALITTHEQPAPIPENTIDNIAGNNIATPAITPSDIESIIAATQKTHSPTQTTTHTPPSGQQLNIAA